MSGLDGKDSGKSKKEGWRAMCEKDLDELEHLGDVERKMVVENGWCLGVSGSQQYQPYFQSQRLTDHDISTGLHSRTLVTGTARACEPAGMGTSSAR